MGQLDTIAFVIARLYELSVTPVHSRQGRDPIVPKQFLQSRAPAPCLGVTWAIGSERRDAPSVITWCARVSARVLYELESESSHTSTCQGRNPQHLCAAASGFIADA